jgi:hypothetical protein
MKTMSLINPAEADGPIPGENYTSDTRNYPWHRPPDITDIDEAIEYVSRNLVQTNDGMRYMAMLEIGIPISAITDMIVTMGVGDGKFTPDFAILIAGPVARLLMVMAKSYEIDYNMGLEMGNEIITPSYLKSFAPSDAENKTAEEAIREEAAAIVAEEEVEDPGEELGLMSPAPLDEQEAMLGYNAPDGVVEEDGVGIDGN